MKDACPKWRQGLASADAAARLAADGPNELPRVGRRSVWRIAMEVLREPMLALLMAGGVDRSLSGFACACLTTTFRTVADRRVVASAAIGPNGSTWI